MAVNSRSHFDKLCRTRKFDDANVDVPIRAPYKRVFQETRESRAHCCAPLHALQFLPDSPIPARDASDGSKRHGSRLVIRGANRTIQLNET